LIDGLIVKGIAGFYYVKTESGTYQCKARGIFKKNGITPMVGDNVKIQVLEDGGAVIGEIGDRKNAFVRPPVSNVEAFIIVVSATKPEPNFLIIDRFLVMAEKNKTQVIVCVNKIDVAAPEKVQYIDEIYGGIYPTVHVSGETGDGICELIKKLGSMKCALAGPSGVGKSTLLNAMDPSISVETGEISKKTDRGKHTTRHAEIFEASFGAMIFDTPGFTSFEGVDTEPETLQHFFPEIDKWYGKCKYNDCNHLSEPGCMVREAVEAGKIHRSRYSSYVELYREVKEKRVY